MKLITKELMDKAEQLSSEWNNTAFIVTNPDGTMIAIVFQHYKGDKRPYVAWVNGNDGWKLTETSEKLGYKFEKEIN